jgi:hypothetical protein
MAAHDYTIGDIRRMFAGRGWTLDAEAIGPNERGQWWCSDRDRARVDAGRGCGALLGQPTSRSTAECPGDNGREPRASA